MTQNDLARRLVDARRSHRPVDALPAASVPPDAATAYAVQQAVLAGLGTRAGGWKVGAKAPRAEAFGAPIPAPAVFASPARVERGQFFHVLVELEIAFRFAEPIPPRADTYARDEVLRRIAQILPAIEIVDSRYAEWPNVAPLAQLADAQNNGALVTGHGLPYRELARGFDFVEPELELAFDGRSLVPEAPGNPAGDPRELLVWFVNHCAARGITIDPSWTVTTGSYVGAHRVEGPGIVHAHIDGLGEVELELV